ncbi:MAG: hypothetical protein O3B01_03620 [Planctomycetota bacterium]|nr:hypothetical protein [Planctomycetota bacterium]MDA1137649.1 hypothetical protein [Planctomycetota bacterium]
MANTNWYRGNLHMHSFWSDGNDFPETVADWFKKNGYHFIAFTEHDQHQIGERWFRCDPESSQGRALANGRLLERYLGRFGNSWVKQREADGHTEVLLKQLSEYRHLFEESDRFLMLNGEEVTTTWGQGKREQQHWINVFNTPSAIPPQFAENGTSVEGMGLSFAAGEEAAFASGREVLTFLNHPNFIWNATAEDIAAVTNLRHVEIHTALNMCETYGDELHASAERIWDIANTIRLAEMDGEIIYGLATDDCHAYAHHHRLELAALPGRAWLMVQAERLTPDLIVSAINDGRFYSSTGVTLTAVENQTTGIRLEIEPVAGVSYRTEFIGTRKGCDLSSEPVTDSEGRPVRTTRRYSSDIGCVLAVDQSLSPTYRLKGDELFVRANVISDAPHPNPTTSGDTQKAWTQPVVA